MVVDDGSKDGSVEKLNKLKEKSPCPFKVIAQENTGNIGMNMNRCVAASRGEFILTISLDDMIPPNSLGTKMKYLLQDSKIACLVSLKGVEITSDGKFYKKFFNDRIYHGITNEEICETQFQRGVYAVQNSIMRREIFDLVGGYDEDLKGDDIVLTTKLAQYMVKNPEWRFEVENETDGVYYRLHKTNITRNSKHVLEVYLEVYERYWKDRDYPDDVKEAISNGLTALPYETCLEIFKNYPKAMDLLNNDNRFKKIVKYKLKNEKSKILKYIFRYEPTFKRNNYRIFNVKLSFKTR